MEDHFSEGQENDVDINEDSGIMGADWFPFWSSVSYTNTPEIDFPDGEYIDPQEANRCIEDWVRRWRSFMESKASGAMFQRHQEVRNCIRLYSSGQASTKAEDYQKGDKEAPATTHNRSMRVYRHVRRMKARYSARSLDVTVFAANPEARSDILNKIAAEQANRTIQQEAPDAAALLGISAPPAPEEDSSPFVVDESGERGVRTLEANRVQEQLRKWMRDNDFESIRGMLDSNYLITDSVCAFVRIDPHTLDPVMDVVRPDQLIYDLDMEDDTGRGMQYIGYYQWMPITSVMREFPDVKEEDIRAAAKSNAGNFSSYGTPATYRDSESDLSVLIFRIYFLYGHTLQGPDGPIVYEQVYEHVSCFYELELYSGAMRYQLRSAEFPGKGILPGVLLVQDHYMDQFAQPTLSKIAYAIEKYELILAKFMDEVVKIERALTVINTDYIPFGDSDTDIYHNPQQIFQSLKEEGVLLTSTAALETAQKSTNLNLNAVMQTYNRSITDLSGYATALAEYRQIIDEGLGDNAQLRGDQGQYTKARVAQMNFDQAIASTYYSEVQYNRFLERLMMLLANYLKLSLFYKDENNPFAAMQIDQDLYQMPTNNLLLQDMGIILQISESDEAVKQKITPIVNEMAIAGQIPYQFYLNFMINPNPRDAVREAMQLMADIEKKQQEQQEMQMAYQAAQQQEQQAQQADMKAAETQSKILLKEMDGQQQQDAILTQGAMNIASAREASDR